MRKDFEMRPRVARTSLEIIRMVRVSLPLLVLLLDIVLAEETTTVSAATTLGTLYRQARSEQYGYASRYGSDSSVTSGSIGIRPEPLEHRDAAYFESRCITCDPSKPAVPDRGWRQRPRPMSYYGDDLEDRRYRDRYDDYYDRGGLSPMGYEYDRPRGPGLANDYDRARGAPYDYDRARGPAYDYDRARAPSYDYDRPDPYYRNEIHRPMMPVYGDRYDMRYDRDRTYYDPKYDPAYDPKYDPKYDRKFDPKYDPKLDPKYDPKYDRNYERGNGYDNLDQRYQPYGSRYDRYNMPARRPMDPIDPYGARYDPYAARYDPYAGRYAPPSRTNYDMRYDPYDRYDPHERNFNRRPYDERYPPPPRGGPPDSRGYYASGAWGPGYDRGYASAWNYSGTRDTWRDPNRDRNPGNNDSWRDLNRDRDPGLYRPRDYFYDSTAAPGGGSRVTSYLHDRPESSTKPDSSDRDKATSSPKAQDNKVYQD